MTGAGAVGLYGFRVTGAPLGEAATADVSPAWPTFHLSTGALGAWSPEATPRIGADRAVVRMADGERWLVADRGAGSATFHGPPLEPAELAHPYLSPAAAIFSRWHGREVFHAGAFVGADGKAIAVRGRRDAGKSTLLAALAARGVPVLADDLVVVEHGSVFAGPRTIDLRAEPNALLTGDGARPVTRARSGTRWRLGLPPVDAVVPLGGWVFLAPMDPAGRDAPLEVRPVQPPLGLSRVARGRGYPELGSDPKVVLDLASLPAIELRLARSWTALERAVDVLAGPGPPI